MLVLMKAEAEQDEIEAVVSLVESGGAKARSICAVNGTTIEVPGNRAGDELAALECLPGVNIVVAVADAYPLASRKDHPERSVVSISGVQVGGNGVVVVGGPCAVESYDQTRTIAEGVRESGAQLFRGGAYKPRTSPYSFQGLGERGLEILARVREEFALPIVTEAVDVESMKLIVQYADCIQIGARNMQNFSLLKAAGKERMPVLLKRGLSATLEELLFSAEYIMSEGNREVILCERGVRTFANHTRNTVDLSVVPAIRQLSHLPVLVDPSHGTGRRESVLPMSRAAIAIGADGVLVEVHHRPQEALSDGPQALLPEQFAEVVRAVDRTASILDRSLLAQRAI